VIKHLTKHCNSLALVIEKRLLDLLNITDKTPLDVVTDGTRLIVQPTGKSRHTKLDAWIALEDKRHSSVYKRLSSPQKGIASGRLEKAEIAKYLGKSVGKA
jgi:antitoxin component of MazEF toxin-antitoxin module